MQMDESIAKYVLSMIQERETYRELTIEDRHVQKLLREAFPAVVQKLEQDAFSKWVWTVMVNGEESVVRAQHDVDTLVNMIRHAQEAHSSSLASDCLQDELTEKLDALHTLKWRVFDQLLADPSMHEALKRKWLEVTGQMPVSASAVQPSGVPPASS